MTFQPGEVFYTFENGLYSLYKVLADADETVYVRAYWPDITRPAADNLAAFDLRTSCELSSLGAFEKAFPLLNQEVTAEEIQDYQDFLYIRKGLESRSSALAELLQQAAEQLNAGNLEAAVHLYTEAASFSRNDHVIFDRRGYSFLQLERYGEAIADFEHSLSLLPGNRDTLFHCAEAYFYSGKHAKAVEKLKQLLALDDAHADAKELLDKIRMLG